MCVNRWLLLRLLVVTFRVLSVTQASVFTTIVEKLLF